MQCKAYSKQLFMWYKTALRNCPKLGSLNFPKVTSKLVQHIKNDQIQTDTRFTALFRDYPGEPAPES